MAKDNALKPRNPTSQLLLSLFVPFYYFHWLFSSHKQINQLNRRDSKTKDASIRMGPGWSLGLFAVGLAFIVAAVVVAIVGDVEVEEYSLAPVQSVSAHSDGTYHSHTQDYSYVLTADPNTPSSDQPYTVGQDDYTSSDLWFLGLYVLGALIFLAFTIVHFFYLLQHTNGVVAAVGSDQDKTILIVMAAIGCFVFMPLLLAVVYKSQSALNQAIDHS